MWYSVLNQEIHFVSHLFLCSFGANNMLFWFLSAHVNWPCDLFMCASTVTHLCWNFMLSKLGAGGAKNRSCLGWLFFWKIPKHTTRGCSLAWPQKHHASSSGKLAVEFRLFPNGENFSLIFSRLAVQRQRHFKNARITCRELRVLYLH